MAQVRARAVRRRRGRRGVKQGAAIEGGGGGGGDGGGGGEGELVFMGDDTWTSLYPAYFSRSYPFPSFNTRWVGGWAAGAIIVCVFFFHSLTDG